MSKTWVLDTETKGTGAHVAPLQKKSRPSRSEGRLALVELARPPRPQRPPELPAAKRFKLVDLMSGRPLAEDIDARETVELLEGFDNPLDVNIYAWSEKSHRWRLLTLGQRRRLWEFRGRLDG